MGFGSFGAGNERAPHSEINMVPLIDVMLVLLIVFMITAPLLTHSVNIDLPQASSPPAGTSPEVVTLAIDAEGRLYWNDALIASTELPARLAATAARTPQPELHLRADRDTRYQTLAEVMSQARSAGIEKMGFVTRPGEAP